MGSGVRLFQAQFCAYAMLINETPELTLCFSYGKHGMCGMTGSNVMEAVAKAAIIFYSNIKHILPELHAALLVYHMLYVTIPM